MCIQLTHYFIMIVEVRVLYLSSSNRKYDLSLFRVRSWNNDMRCMPFCILILSFNVGHYVIIQGNLGGRQSSIMAVWRYGIHLGREACIYIEAIKTTVYYEINRGDRMLILCVRCLRPKVTHLWLSCESREWRILKHCDCSQWLISSVVSSMSH